MSDKDSRYKILPEKNILLLVIGLAVVLRVIGLDRSFQGDEFLSVLNSRHSLSQIPSALMTDSHPPLYFYMLNLTMKLPWSEPTLRFLSVIAGVGICVLAYLIGATASSTRTGIIASFLTALAPGAVWVSQYVRSYAWAAFFSVASVYILVRIIKGCEKEFLCWILFVLFSAASIYTFYFAALFIAAENFFTFAYLRSKRPFLRKWVVSQLSIAVLYIPWIPFFLEQRSSYMGHSQLAEKIGFHIGNVHLGGVVRSGLGLFGLDPRFMAKASLSQDALYRAIGAIFIVTASCLFVWLCLRVFMPLKTAKNERPVFLQLFTILGLVPFILALILHQTAGIVLMSNYFVSSFVFLAIVAAMLLERPGRVKIAAAVIAALAIIYIWRLVCMYQDKEMDFRAAAEYARNIVTKNSIIVAPTRSAFGGIAGYYLAGIAEIYYVEDPKTIRVSKRDILFVTSPLKLELRGYNDGFESFIKTNGYRSLDSRMFGDLVIKRYSKI